VCRRLSETPCPQGASDLEGHGFMSLRLPTLMIPRLEQAGQTTYVPVEITLDRAPEN
jgi:hypothetical protein